MNRTLVKSLRGNNCQTPKKFWKPKKKNKIYKRQKKKTKRDLPSTLNEMILLQSVVTWQISLRSNLSRLSYPCLVSAYIYIYIYLFTSVLDSLSYYHINNLIKFSLFFFDNKIKEAITLWLINWLKKKSKGEIKLSFIYYSTLLIKNHDYSMDYITSDTSNFAMV